MAIPQFDKGIRQAPGASQTREVERALEAEMDTMAAAVNYRAWLHRLIRPYLGETVLEVGAGTGEFAESYSGHRRVVVSDVHPEFVTALTNRFSERAGFEIDSVSVETPITKGPFDSVVALNLLEHIPDDVDALTNMSAGLAPGGRIILFVPAFPALYGPLDREVGHFRRYTTKSLSRAVKRAGLEVEEMRFVNSVGMIAWWTFVRLLRGSRTSDLTVTAYDRMAIPLISRLESRIKPPFGQSLLCVARMPVGTGERLDMSRTSRAGDRRGFRKLSVVMPVYNEEADIVDTLDRVLSVDLPSTIEMEVIVVDDGSTDQTAELLDRYSDHPLVFVHTSVLNLGKGTAVRTGLAHTSGDIVIIQDGDREYSPNDYPALIRPIVEGRAAVVYGTRFRRDMGSAPTDASAGSAPKGAPSTRARRQLIWPDKMPLPNYIANLILRWTTNGLFAADITDEASAYKVFRSDVLSEFDLVSRRFEICPELTAKTLRHGHRIHEVPITYSARRMEQGRKIRWYDLFSAVWTLLKYRFAPVQRTDHAPGPTI